MRIIPDTNILLSCIPRKSPYRVIFESLVSGKFELIITNEILSEYTEIIGTKTNNLIANNISELLLNLSNVQLLEVFYRWHQITQDRIQASS